MLSRTDILNRRRPAIRRVELPISGGGVCVRVRDPQHWSALMLTQTLCDDRGELLFSAADVPQLLELPPAEFAELCELLFLSLDLAAAAVCGGQPAVGGGPSAGGGGQSAVGGTIGPAGEPAFRVPAVSQEKEAEIAAQIQKVRAAWPRRKPKKTPAPAPPAAQPPTVPSIPKSPNPQIAPPMSTRIGSVVINLLANTAGLVSGCDRGGKALSGLGRTADQAVGALGRGARQIEGMGSAFELLGAVGAGPIGAMGALAAVTVEEAHRMADLVHQAERVHVSVEDLQRLRWVGRDSGVDVESLGRAFQSLGRSIGEAQLNGGANFAQLGISPEDLRGDRMEILEKVARGLQKVGDENRRTLLETQIFGKTGADLDIVLEKLAEGGLKDVEVQSEETALAMKNLWDASKRTGLDAVETVAGTVAKSLENLAVLLSFLAGSGTTKAVSQIEAETNAVKRESQAIKDRIAARLAEQAAQKSHFAGAEAAAAGSREAARILQEANVPASQTPVSRPNAMTPEIRAAQIKAAAAAGAIEPPSITNLHPMGAPSDQTPIEDVIAAPFFAGVEGTREYPPQVKPEWQRPTGFWGQLHDTIRGTEYVRNDPQDAEQTRHLAAIARNTRQEQAQPGF
jgi:hypothetical protein